MSTLGVSVLPTEEWILEGNPEMKANLVVQTSVHYCAPVSLWVWWCWPWGSSRDLPGSPPVQSLTTNTRICPWGFIFAVYAFFSCPRELFSVFYYERKNSTTLCSIIIQKKAEGLWETSDKMSLRKISSYLGHWQKTRASPTWKTGRGKCLYHTGEQGGFPQRVTPVRG